MIINTFITFAILIHIFTLVDAQQRQPGQCCEEYCYSTDGGKPQSIHFATKSAYQLIKGNSTEQFVVPNCNPVKFWFLVRHGTRLPIVDDIPDLRLLEALRDEIIDNYEKKGTKPDFGGLCDEDLELIRSWQWNSNITTDSSLLMASEGRQEMLTLAENYQSVFPNVLEKIYTPEKYRFHFTDFERTETSTKLFAEGLFGNGSLDDIQMYRETGPPYMFLEPYHTCKTYKKNQAWVLGPDSEYTKFENSDAFNQVIYEVSTRLGFKSPITYKQMSRIYDMCRFNLAWDVERTSPWCAAFIPNHFRALEYHQDLRYYYWNSYGARFNNELSCQLVVDMLDHFESQTNPKVVAYFTISATLQMFLTALGVHKDSDTLRADNYQQMMRRKWSTSVLTPFAGNLAAIKYECPNDNERNKVKFFLNQKPLDLDWCNAGLCDWSKVQEMYSSFKQHDCLTTLTSFCNK